MSPNNLINRNTTRVPKTKMGSQYYTPNKKNPQFNTTLSQSVTVTFKLVPLRIVFFQSILGAEPRPALRTHVQAIAHVPLLVLLEVVLPAERGAAHLADERLDRAVAGHVLLEVAGLGERLAAVVADKALVARVDPHVLVQVGGGLEGRAAHAAAVGPGVAVRALVLSQVGGDGEGLAALSAHVLLDPRVLQHVDPQVLGAGERRSALLARVAPLLGFRARRARARLVPLLRFRLRLAVAVPRPDVLFQVAGLHESPAAELTLEALVAGVDSPVLGQVGGGGERRAALFAYVRSVPRVRSHVRLQVAGFGETGLAELAVKQFVAVVGCVSFQFQQRCEKFAAFNADVSAITFFCGNVFCGVSGYGLCRCSRISRLGMS